MKINIPETIDLAHPEKYILTIYIHPEGFSFLIHHQGEEIACFYQKLVNEGHADAFSDFKEIYFENEFFTLPFRTVLLMNCTPVFTYIPEIIYEDKYKSDFMKFLFFENSGTILEHSLQASGIIILHELPEDIYRFFQRSYVNPQFIHHSAPLIAYFQKNSKQLNTKQMIANKNGEEMDILCFSGETFLLGNHFRCRQLSDAVYYILFIWKQLKFNQLEDYLQIAGDAVSKAELQEKLKLYLQHVSFAEISSKLHLPQNEEVPFELTATCLCEL
jgi:hypothetical protein